MDEYPTNNTRRKMSVQVGQTIIAIVAEQRTEFQASASAKEPTAAQSSLVGNARN